MPREETLYDSAELFIIFFGGIGGNSKRGILVKSGNYLEVLNKVEVVVFDKTVYTRFFELYITC